jgi:hypothetical protein
MTVREQPPNCNCCCVGTSHDFEDFRFLKDVTWEERKSCLCLERRECVLKFEASNTVTASGEQANVKAIVVAHPEMTKEAVNNIKAQWAEARLVAD